MNLVEEYRRQFEWRSWSDLVAALPPLDGTTVLDLGCGIGDQAALLAALGARVIGFDLNDDFLAAARSRRIAGAEFHRGDLHRLPDPGVVADGARGSFVAACFTDLPAALVGWARHLRPEAFVALTEVDNLFGHEPVAASTRSLLEAYADEAVAAGRYDFRMGRHLAGHLERAGFSVIRSMPVLHEFCGDEFAFVRDDLLACLSRADHHSTATIRFCLATTPAAATGHPGGGSHGPSRGAP